MTTPVIAARQCLTDKAARALDDAVVVAHRRSHAQTTLLHVVSALLSLPSLAFRDACTRPRSRAYSSRLQFWALELSVGVSLDRLPSSKAQNEPPVSNSLMVMIKRSQANQRQHLDPALSRFSFPFSKFEDRDENSSRIADVLVRKSGKNILLKSSTEAVQKGKAGIFPVEIDNFSVVSIEKEVFEFDINGGSKEKMGSSINLLAIAQLFPSSTYP
ncbi:hypothetical protein ACFX13_047998 [Malus domestica]|uniref:Clp R domain-containing protein n=1 Tax=Malus domestica TaxID=3750 RepID=A0A498J5W6_MALDO|nr:hypothetical protein DVH24_035350 [Malus domestica]